MAKQFTEVASPKEPKYFYLLDIVRGFAALSVVLWHWQHFYTTPDDALETGFHVSQQPFYSILYPFYNNGVVAVDMFFLISGFVFFFLYFKSVRDRHLSAGSFFVLRFSRLYPLQLITLFIVLFLQTYFYRHNAYYFVYPFNDGYHFILNLFFTTSWGLEKGPSFNGPNWSVSVEVLLYAIFFAVCYFRFKKYSIWILTLAGLLVQVFYAPIGHGLLSFFGGGLLYYLYLRILDMDKQRLFLKALQAATLLFVILILLDSKYSFIENTTVSVLHRIKPQADASFTVTRLMSLVIRIVVFPVFVLYLVLLETVKGAKGKRLSFIGNISYSSYLLHFPLQLIVVGFFGQWITDKDTFFNSGYTLVVFFAVLIVISLLSYYYFELPLQRYLRKRFLPAKP